MIAPVMGFPQSPVQPGDVLADKYVVEAVLGMGGMGVVVAARHRLLGGRVALKFVLPHLSTAGSVVKRFLKEAKAATRITSEHVARVSDVGMLESGAPYMVMEYLEGQDLAELLKTNGPLPVETAVDYLMQALQAIAEAHAQGIVHRDLKPSNLFLTQRADGTPLVKVLDFGIAKALTNDDPTTHTESELTKTQGTLGSPLYMSPEQIRSSRRVDERTDIWSCGVMLYELVSGRRPFEEETSTGLLAAIVSDPPRSLRADRPDAPERLEHIVAACLEKDRERRVQNAGDLAASLAPLGTTDARLSLSRIEGITGRSGHAQPLDAVRARPAPVTAKQGTHSNWGATSPEGPAVPTRRSALFLSVAGFAIVALLGGSFVLLRGTGSEGEPELASTREATGVAAPAKLPVTEPAEAVPPTPPLPSASGPRVQPVDSAAPPKNATIAAAKPETRPKLPPARKPKARKPKRAARAKRAPSEPVKIDMNSLIEERE